MLVNAAVDEIITAFGGLTAMSRALGHRHATTVDGWKRSGRIPAWRRPEIIAAAKRIGVELPAEFLADSAPDAAAVDGVPAEPARVAAARSVA